MKKINLIHCVSNNRIKWKSSLKKILCPCLIALILFFPSIGNSQQIEQLSIEPAKSQTADPVVFSGVTFDADPSRNVIEFEGEAGPVTAEWVSVDQKYLVVVVPPGAFSGPVDITVDNKIIGRGIIKIKAIFFSFYMFLGLFIGILLRTFIPYINKSAKTGSFAFKTQFFIPPLLTMLLMIPTAIMLLPDLSYTGNSIQDFIAAFTVAYSTQDLVREVQKSAEA